MSWRPLQLSTNQDCDSSRKALPWWRFYPRAQQNLCFYPFMMQYIKRQHDNLFYQCSFPLLLPSTDTTSFYRVFRSRFYRQERELVWLSFIPTLIDENGYTRCIHIHRQLTIAFVAKNDKLGVWITKMWNKAEEDVMTESGVCVYMCFACFRPALARTRTVPDAELIALVAPSSIGN